MTANAKRRKFRDTLNGADCVFAADVFDPISARIADDLGFKIGMLAGSVASMTVLGAPDLALLTLTELADQARRICRASDIPLMIDADHGYGNALNAERTVIELENAGVAALTIEDTLLPAPFGGDDKSLITLAEGERKLGAALAARTEPDLVIVARTACASIEGIGSAVERAKAYERLSVDALFFSGIRTRDEISRLRDAVKLPILLGAVPGEISDIAFLSSHGVRICLQGHRPFLAAVRACYETLKSLSEKVPPETITGIASSDLVARVTRKDRYATAMQKFLKP